MKNAERNPLKLDKKFASNFKEIIAIKIKQGFSKKEGKKSNAAN